MTHDTRPPEPFRLDVLPLGLARPALDLHARFRRATSPWLLLHAIEGSASIDVVSAPATIWFVTAGSVEIAIDDTVVDLGGGDVLVLPAGEHMKVTPSPDAAVTVVAPPPAVARASDLLIERTRVERCLTPVEHLRVQGVAAGLSTPESIASLLAAVLERIVSAQRETHAQLVERTPGRTLRNRHQLYARLLRSRFLVESGRTRDFVMPELARYASLSVWHYIRTFAHVFGETPHRFLTRVRLERAANLLATTRVPVRLVANVAGFENRSAFSRLFRLHFGVPASEYRAAREARAS